MILKLSPDPSSIEKAAQLIKAGELVAFPTETVYGLGASIFQPEAILQIFRVKGRPQDNPLIAHLGNLDQVEQVAKEIPNDFYRLATAFLPGPLTIVLKRQETIPSIVSGGGDTLAVRLPSHPVAIELIHRCGFPLVAPSANLSGKPSSTTADHVIEDFTGKIAAVLDGGPCEIGLESTVISLCAKAPLLLRPGMISQEDIEAILGKPLTFPSAGDFQRPESPGMKYRHYAPEAPVYLFPTQKDLDRHLATYPNRKRGIFCPQPETLYALLRSFDLEGCEEICLLCDPLVQKNPALMNRILKAAGKTCLC